MPRVVPQLHLNGWNPIETAPTDPDTPVLIWNGYIIVVGCRVEDGYWEYSEGGFYMEPAQVRGVAWMPLPPAPYYK